MSIYDTDEHRPDLANIVTSRIMMAAGLAILIQMFVCLAENYGDKSYFGGWLIKLETNRIYDALHIVDDQIRVLSHSSLSHYKGEHAASYAYRLLDRAGNIVGASNIRLINQASPYAVASTLPPDSWLQSIDQEKWFHITGGKKFSIAGKPVWIEVATLGDPAFQRYRALLMDMIDDVLIPVLPTILILATLAILSVRGALRPLTNSSFLAETFETKNIDERILIKGMPEEAARFCMAINRLLDRVATMILSQKLFISRAAHELRTPLGIMLLELGMVSDPRARNMEKDISLMTGTVNRLLGLARLEVIEGRDLRTIDLHSVVSEIVKYLEPLSQERHCVITLNKVGRGEFKGDFESVREAVLNVIENAMKHSPVGARVNITCGPEGRILVEDDGPGIINEKDHEWLFEPFSRGTTTTTEGSGLGLAIVTRTVELHGGSIEVDESSLGGTQICLHFPTKSQPNPKTAPGSG